MEPVISCIVCLGPVPKGSVITYNNTESVCIVCARDTIVPLFHGALESEYRYSELNVMRLDANDFVTLLGAEFVARLDRLREEYTTIGNRIYCPHVIVSSTAPPRGATAETTLALTHEELVAAEALGIDVQPCGAMACAQHEITTNVSCYHCRGMLCGRCGKTEAHTSSQDCTLSLDPDADPLAGTNLRGQRCPTCGTFWEQHDGCNHGICPNDSTNFCFHCGQEATDESGHWTMPSPCPRWPPSVVDGVARFDGSPIEFDARGLPVARFILDGDPHRLFMNATDFVRIFQAALLRRFNMPLPAWVHRLPDNVEFVADISRDGLSGHYIGLVAFSEQTTEDAAQIELLDGQVRAWFDSPGVFGPDVSGEDTLVVFAHHAWTTGFLVDVDIYGQPIEDDEDDTNGDHVNDSDHSGDSDDSEDLEFLGHDPFDLDDFGSDSLHLNESDEDDSDDWETIDGSDLDEPNDTDKDDSDDWEDMHDPELDESNDSVKPDHSELSNTLSSREHVDDTHDADHEDHDLPARCTGQ